MSKELSRIDLQRNEDNSSVKQFLQDQLGILLTVVGGVPIFFEYFGLIDKPHTLSELSLRALSLTSFLICSMLILFIYGERRHFVRECRVYCLILGILFMFAGLGLLAIYVYEPTYDKLLVNYRSPNNYQVFLYGPGTPPMPPPTPDGAEAPITISYFSYVLTILIGTAWVAIVSRLILLINRRIREVNLEEPKRYNDRESKKYKRPFLIKKLINWGFLKNNHIVADDTFILYEKKVKRGVSWQIVILILFGILLVILAISKPIHPAWLQWLEKIKPVTIRPEKVSVLTTGVYILYYPFLVTGIVLMATVILNSFEGRRNFYQNINRLSEHFYIEIEKMVASLVEFEVWFDKEELRYREGKLLGKRTPRDEDTKKEIEAKNPVQIELDVNDVKEAQRLFIWQVMRAKTAYYSSRISEFSKLDGRMLKISGDLLDDVFRDYMPRADDELQEFKAVSSGDIQFWKKRGEEYITWNKDMIKYNIRVTRIFLIKMGDYFKGKVPDDEKENFAVLFNQVDIGIRVFICYEENIIGNDGTHFGLNRNDFGVYPNFAISFFDKPLRIGGRSLLMAFDKDVIKDFTDYYDLLLKKCDNSESIKKTEVSIEAQKKLLKAGKKRSDDEQKQDEDEQKQDEADQKRLRLEALRDYLVNTWASENFKGESNAKRLIEVRERIKEAAGKYLNPGSQSTSNANGAVSSNGQNGKSRWSWFKSRFRKDKK